MNSQRAGLRVAGVMFGLICLGHAWRLIAQAQVHIGNYILPMWVSWLGLIVAGGLSLWLLKLSSKTGP